MATDKILKQAIKNVLDAEYVGKEIQFTETWGFKVESYNIRTRSRFIPQKEREEGRRCNGFRRHLFNP